jgi:hypothetical protein
MGGTGLKPTIQLRIRNIYGPGSREVDPLRPPGGAPCSKRGAWPLGGLDQEGTSSGEAQPGGRFAYVTTRPLRVVTQETRGECREVTSSPRVQA